MKYKAYLMLLVLAISLTGCGREQVEEEPETQTDTIETLHITIENEIAEKQENFYKISDEFNDFIIDYSAYDINIQPTLFIQLFNENGEEKYYIKANGDGTPYTGRGISYDLGSPLILMQRDDEYYIAFNFYKDASVKEWSDGKNDGLYYYDEAFNLIQPKNLLNAISITDFADVNQISKENLIALFKKGDTSTFINTYKNELQQLADIEKDWNFWKHSSYFDENGPIYEGILTEEYIISALSNNEELSKQKERDLLIEKESMNIQKVYQVINEDGTVSYISQDGNDMVINEKSEPETELQTETMTEAEDIENSTESFTEETEISETQEPILPQSLFDESGTEFVFYSEIKNIDDNGNVYYEIIPIQSLQSLISYIKVYYDEPSNTQQISGIQFVEKEYENALEDYYISLEDIQFNISNEPIITIGDSENVISFYLYDPDNAYVNKKIFTLDKNKSCLYAVIKENEFLSFKSDNDNYKEISYEEFCIIFNKIKEFEIAEENTEETAEVATEIDTEEMSNG